MNVPLMYAPLTSGISVRQSTVDGIAAIDGAAVEGTAEEEVTEEGTAAMAGDSLDSINFGEQEPAVAAEETACTACKVIPDGDPMAGVARLSAVCGSLFLIPAFSFGIAAVSGIASARAGVSDILVSVAAGRAWLPEDEGASVGSGGAPLGSMPLLEPLGTMLLRLAPRLRWKRTFTMI